MSWLWKKIKLIPNAAGKPEFLFWFITFWAAIILLGGIRVGDLSGYDDAAYAHEARKMLETGDWWTLSLNGSPDFDKPPLFIWTVVLSFKIFGMTDFAAKIPGVIFGWGTILTTYFLSKELFCRESEETGKWLATLAMLALASTQYFLKYSSHAMTDVPFTFFFTVALYFYLRGLGKPNFLLLCGISIGLGMLIRSPMGIFPLAIIFFHLIISRRAKLLLSPAFTGLVILSLVLPAIWYLTEYRIFGGLFTDRHFGNFLAHSASSASKTQWQQFLWYFEYIFKLGSLYLPWFPFMLHGIFLSVKRWKGNESVNIESFLLIWLLLVLIPFSIADSKVLRYILPVFPALSIYTAYSLKKILATRYLPKFTQIVPLILFFGGLWLTLFPNFQERAADMRIIAPLTDGVTKTDERVVLYTFGELHWNYQTQLIWYGNRNCQLVKDFSEIEKIVQEKGEITLVIDENSFEILTRQIPLEIDKIGSSEKFIALRVRSPKEKKVIGNKLSDSPEVFIIKLSPKYLLTGRNDL